MGFYNNIGVGLRSEKNRIINHIHHISKKYGKIIVNDDLTVDVIGGIIFKKELKEFGVDFNVVFGNFDCCGTDITSLKGAPKYIAGDFLCDNCHNLSNLKHAPKVVDGLFACNNSRSLISTVGIGVVTCGFYHKDCPIKEFGDEMGVSKLRDKHNYLMDVF